MNIGICEDEKTIQDKLENIVNEYYKQKKVSANIDTFENGNDFLEECKTKDYSFVFMDIDLKDSNGVETAKEFRDTIKTPTAIIFITSYEEHKNIVFPLHTFDYIIKPFRDDGIVKVLDELNLWLDITIKKETKKIPFKTTSGLVYLSTNSIQYLEYKNRKIDIVLNNQSFSVYDTIKNIKNELLEHGFAIPHSAFIVNLSRIENFSQKNLIMENSDEIPIARSRLKEFREAYLEFIEE